MLRCRGFFVLPSTQRQAETAKFCDPTTAICCSTSQLSVNSTSQLSLWCYKAEEEDKGMEEKQQRMLEKKSCATNSLRRG